MYMRTMQGGGKENEKWEVKRKGENGEQMDGENGGKPKTESKLCEEKEDL